MRFSISLDSEEAVFVDNMQRLVHAVAARCPSKQLPSAYLVVDVETSGFHWNRKTKPDVVVQIGYAAIRDRQIVKNDAFYVKRPPGTMGKEASEVTGITDAILSEKGIEPAEIYPQFVHLMELYRSGGCMFMGHNMISFDAPFLAADLARQGIPFRFSPNEYIDTGMLFKAAQLRTAPGLHEDLHGFFSRIKATRSRVKWRLTTAIERLGLHTQHGIDLNKAHDAGFDCWMTHLLFEELRSLAEGRGRG